MPSPPASRKVAVEVALKIFALDITNSYIGSFNTYGLHYPSAMATDIDATVELETKYNGTLTVYVFDADTDDERYRIETDRGTTFNADRFDLQPRFNNSVWAYLGDRSVTHINPVNTRRFEVELGRAAGSFVAE